ncbi:hypothetical protein [Clostridium sp. BNL1100]|uniref:hypothetical protein n=1 Tax=Clostridium sp. BNL1100 TaxID=755731 RepID=UPI00024A7EFD|nr:hypothetical protein [Clostridium sp. BNL1100]AEY65398.1 hypothetical protein Clo1100_1146 [Clostridium sp. BNL1100]
MKKIDANILESFVKIFPHKKISKDVYIFINKPSRMPKLAKTELKELFETLWQFITAPLLLVIGLYKLFKVFLPVIYIRRKE